MPAPATLAPERENPTATSAPTSEDAYVRLTAEGGPADGTRFRAMPRHTGTTVPPYTIHVAAVDDVEKIAGDVLTPHDLAASMFAYHLDRPGDEPGSWIMRRDPAVHLPVLPEDADDRLAALDAHGEPVTLHLCSALGCWGVESAGYGVNDGTEHVDVADYTLTGGAPGVLDALRARAVSHALHAAHDGGRYMFGTHADVVQLVARIDAATGRTGERA